MPPLVDSDYAVGTEVVLEATFRDDVGDLADPTTVTCRVINPLGVEADVTPVTNPSIGVYRAVQLADEGGIWRFRFKGVGAVVIADEDRFDVERTPFVVT